MEHEQQQDLAQHEQQQDLEHEHQQALEDWELRQYHQSNLDNRPPPKCCFIEVSYPTIDAWRFTSANLPLVFTPPILIVGIWALVQSTTTYYPITMGATIFGIVISALLIIVGVVEPIVYLVNFIIVQRVQVHNIYGVTFRLTATISIIMISVAFILIALGITSAALTTSVAGILQASANNSLNNYLNDQSIQENWNAAQQNLQCCGAVMFTDYGEIFTNNSVPVSCCNTTNSLANYTTCPAIVANATLANQTGLIYFQGCASLWEPIFVTKLSIIGIVCIITGIVQIVGTFVLLYRFLTSIHC